VTLPRGLAQWVGSSPTGMEAPRLSGPKTAARLAEAAWRLQLGLRQIEYGPPAAWVYAPWEYAWPLYASYLGRYARGQRAVLWLGMNPGPWGMLQTGIPFGEVAAVRDWMGLTGEVVSPPRFQPLRPVQGLACRRSEVSGRRLWGLFASRFGTADAFFQRQLVLNYCPLGFMEAGGRNVTPDKLPSRVRSELQAVCDQHLLEVLEILQPEVLVGIGGFAANCWRRVVTADGVVSRRVVQILHPSPASPAANRDWAGQVTAALEREGVW
jgi:single-strand selective monofunctional uracil DNA glycosylase